MKDIYAEITNRIIAELEKGRIPWHKPWTGGSSMAISHSTGKPYSLLNQILLGWKSGEWLTFKQCQEEGGVVRKGEKSRLIVFWKWMDKKDGEIIVLPDGTEQREQIPFLRYYSVFHIDQCDGITAWHDKPVENTSLTPDAQAEAIIQDYVSRSGVTFISRQSDSAFYRPSEDLVVVPEISQYRQLSEYYSTVFHELTHSTGHFLRLNRLNSTAVLGNSDDYSREELVAEMGSAFLCGMTGLETPDSFRNSAAYIQGWLHALRDDKRLIVSAGGQAQKAVEMIGGDLVAKA